MTRSTFSPRQEKTRILNDRLRVEGRGGKILLTYGMTRLDPDVVQTILNHVRTFNAFTSDNDPFGEHDFGALEVGDFKVMFKIDYYDNAETYHASEKSDEILTTRVMTVMLAGEYQW